MIDDAPPFDTRLAKALAHPLRARVLMVYSGRVASPSQVAAELGAPIADVAYHTKRLLAHECVELVDAVPGRGGVKHFYRATRPLEVHDEEWARMPAGLRERVAQPVIESILEDLAGVLDRADAEAADLHLSRVRLQLDASARAELARILEGVVADAARLEEESAARRAGGPPDATTALAIVHVPRPSR